MKRDSLKLISGHPCYVIAEIGHNHQGEEILVMDLIRAAAESGVNAVKFQKRSNSELFTNSYYQSEYNNPNSFGKTYGEHREFLEPKKEWLQKANNLAHSLGLDFIMTVFDLWSLEFCESFLSVDVYKIQSADLTYPDLIEKVNHTGKPFFLSCGASSLSEIKNAFHFCQSLKADFCLMYAVSAYPTLNEQINLNRIRRLQSELNCAKIGYSCHSPDNKAAVFARNSGAVAIEKHFTLDRSMKGPDHHFSSTPEMMKQLIAELAEADIIAGSDWSSDSGIEEYQLSARYKMGKAAYAIKTLKAGTTLHQEDVGYRSPAAGINPAELKSYIGKTLLADIEKDGLILPEHFNVVSQ